MDSRRILVIDGHPDGDPGRFVHALAESYEQGARAGGHEVRRIDVAALDFALVRTRAEWEGGDVPADIRRAQEAIAWAEHVVILYPLWLGDVPALLKGFLEQVLRPGFAIGAMDAGLPARLLKGRSARLVVTMGMPAFFYRTFYRAHSVRSLERNVLRLVGIAPVHSVLIGTVEGDPADREGWLAKLRALGEKAE